MNFPNMGMIVAHTPDLGVGMADGRLPWVASKLRLKEDMERFVEITTRCGTVVMGRKTWDSLPDSHKPLPNRKNVVLTRNKDFIAPGAKTLGFHWVIEMARHEKVIVIGGPETYKRFKDFIALLYVTEVHAHLPADVFLEAGYAAGYKEIKRQFLPATEKRPALSFVDYVRG